MSRFNYFLINLCLAIAGSLTLLPAPLSAQTFQFNGNRKRSSVAFSLVKNLVVVPLYINDQGPYNFILDTGVGPLIITDTSGMKNLNLVGLRHIGISGLGGGPEIDGLFSNDIQARIAHASIKRIPTAILNEDFLGLSNYLGIKISGLVGYYLLNSFIVKIDYSGKRLVLIHPDKTRKLKGERIPIWIIDRKPYTDLLLRTDSAETKIRMIVDNGASHALSLETLNGMPFPAPTNAVEANLGIGLSGPIKGRIGRSQSVQLGSFVLKDVVSSYPQYADSTIRHFLSNRNGNLGADVLSRFRVIFDYHRTALYLKPNRNFGKPFEHDMSGMEIYVGDTDFNSFFVGRIEHGSPADEAGILAGDQILSVNLNKISELGLDRLTSMLRSGDGKILFLTLIRSGELIVKRIKLKKRI